jgi:hypothetical protein
MDIGSIRRVKAGFEFFRQLLDQLPKISVGRIDILIEPSMLAHLEEPDGFRRVLVMKIPE